MKFKIVCDSVSNLKNDYLVDSEIGFENVPLTLRVNGEIFVDDDQIDTVKLLESMDKDKKAASTACPSPGEYANAFEGAENVFVVTVSGKLSGSYNSAVLASKEFAGKNIHVIDSRNAAGGQVLIVDRLVELIKQDLPFETIVKEIDQYVKDTHIIFVLSKYDNLAKSGRMSKLVAFAASTIKIKTICKAVDGEIEIQSKALTETSAYRKLVENMPRLAETNDFSGRKCVISHTENEESAFFLTKLIKAAFNFAEVVIMKNKGVAAYYSALHGIMVAF